MHTNSIGQGLSKHCVLINSIDQGPAPRQGPEHKYLSLQASVRTTQFFLWLESVHRQQVNKWPCLCSNKTLSIKTSKGPGVAHRLKFVQLCYGSLFLICPEGLANLSQHFTIKSQVALQLFYRTLDILLCPPLVFDVEL